MDITSLLNSKSPEPEGPVAHRSIDTTLSEAVPSLARTSSLNSSAHSPLSNPEKHFLEPAPIHSNIQHPLRLDQQHSQLQSQKYSPPRHSQLPQPTMSHVSHHAYPSNAIYSPPPVQMTQQPPTAVEQTSPDDVNGGSALGKTFICNNCNKSFARRSDLVRHERIHTGVRPHRCDHPGCNKEFIQRSALTVHKRVHTGEKPHKCQSCDKPFSDSSSLARHRRIHSGKRPYKCRIATCGKTFTRKTTQKRHEQQHEVKSGKLSTSVGKTADAEDFSLVDVKQSPGHDEEGVDDQTETMHASDHSDSPVIQQHVPQMMPDHKLVDPGSYTSSGPAQYASRALDMNAQTGMAGPYYKTSTYPSPTDTRQSMLGYPNPGMVLDGSLPAYHAVGHPAPMYDTSRHPSLQHGPSVYNPHEQHMGQFNPYANVHYQHQHPEALPQYQPGHNEWTRSHPA